MIDTRSLWRQNQFFWCAKKKAMQSHEKLKSLIRLNMKDTEFIKQPEQLLWIHIHMLPVFYDTANALLPFSGYKQLC